MEAEFEMRSLSPNLGSIPYPIGARTAGTTCATEGSSIGFNTMADYPAVAMLALGRERVYCTFKAVENVALACEGHLHTLVIIVFTNFALSHSESSSMRSEPGNHVTKRKRFCRLPALNRLSWNRRD
jgi:hypothetical protein